MRIMGHCQVKETDTLLCVFCNEPIELGAMVVGKIGASTKSKNHRNRHYHYNCAKRLNII